MNAPALPLRALTDTVAVAPQLGPEHMAAVAAAGFKSVVCNRPDFEHGPDQPTHAQVQAAAEAAGLQFRFLPVAGGWQSDEEIVAFGALLDELPKPMLAYCRSGARSTQLFLQATQR